MNMDAMIASSTRTAFRNGGVSLSLRRQRGVSLFIALVALVLMTITGFSLMRSVDIGNVIAGNMAFRQLAVNASDLGVEAAARYINDVISPSPDANVPGGCNSAAVFDTTKSNCRYSARSLVNDNNGIPYVDWDSAGIPSATLNGVTYQYVIDRQCNPDLTVPVALGVDAPYSEAERRCLTAVFADGESASSGRHAYKDAGGLTRITPVHYRVTVRVRGPRNTISFVQALMAR